MRTMLPSSPIISWLTRSLKTHKSLCSVSTLQYSSESHFLENPNPNTDFSEKPTSESSASDSRNTQFITPSSKETVFTKTHVIDTLLTHKNDPISALRYFKRAVKMEDFVKDVDVFCVLLHILTGSSGTHRYARNLLNRYVRGDLGPMARVFVDHLIESSKRLDLEFDSQVFGYLLNSYVRAGQIEDAMACIDGMISNNVFPSVLYLNIVLAALVRENMIGRAQHLYNKMISRGFSGDCATIHVMIRGYLKEGKADEAEQCFREAKKEGLL
ncbi:hypothetical protein L1049_017853 [Liquidambar formosana]|uniref:Pentatricopeptide repeat-containing protein n=1 Tax=Liquidambar formosana TaxID=63359 RepID=A0AAP0R9L4_LIQFO